MFLWRQETQVNDQFLTDRGEARSFYTGATRVGFESMGSMGFVRRILV